MLLRGVDSKRRLVDTSNNQNNNIPSHRAQHVSKIVEDLIETSLEHFAHDDATLLAEAYHSRVGTERSLLILAHCLTRARSFENAYHLLKANGNPTAGTAGLKTPKCRYLFAYCAFTLNRLQEAENTLRDTTITDQVQLHSSFQGTTSLPYAHSLLAKILCETNRVESARAHWANSIRQNPMLWTALRTYCDIGDGPIRELLQCSLDELAQWRSNAEVKSINEKDKIKADKEDEEERMSIKTPTRRKNTVSTATTPSGNTIAMAEKRRTRLRNAGADARYNPAAPLNANISSSIALRASENSPLTRSNKLGIGAMLIEQQMQQDDKEEQQLQAISNKRTTRRTTALAAAAAKNKDAEAEMQKLIQQQMHQDRQIYYDLLDSLLQLAEVQERLSHFRCADALHLLNGLNPPLLQLPLSLELRARVFFENGEYKRSCEVFEEIRRLYPRRVQGMEIYSTALWQLHDPKRLSALSAEMADIARDQPAANKFLGFAVKASSKLQEKATSLSAIVSEKTIIGNIEKERQKFIGELGKEKWAKEEAGSLCQLLANPDAQKHIVSISAEAANFTEDPPLSFDLETDIDEIKACACELFMLDPRLKAIRFALVPKQVSEEKFWRNYAYKLSLVKKVVLGEKTQTTTAQSKEPVDGIGAERKESTEGEEDEALEKEFLNDLDEYEVVNGGKKGEAGPGDEEKLAEDELNKEIDALLEEQDGK